MKRLLWRALALLLVGLGLVGVVVPVLPTVPFLLAAAWAAGHGWPALERWILDHPRYGVTVRRWRERGAVSRRAKYLASASMLVSAAVLVFATSAPKPVKVGGPLLLGAVAVWLWRRPDS